MVEVYLMNIKELPDPFENAEVLGGLPETAREKILRHAHEKGRKECLGARLLEKLALQKHGVSMESITYGQYGKPEVNGIYFNISHSKDYVICAVSEKPVGCDIEKVEAARMNVAKKAFTAKEQAYMDGVSEPKKAEAFYRLWTMKESYLKMTGEGMHFPLKQVQLQLGEGEICVLRDGSLCDCFMKEYDLPGYKVTVCAQENAFAEDMIACTCSFVL